MYVLLQAIMFKTCRGLAVLLFVFLLVDRSSASEGNVTPAAGSATASPFPGFRWAAHPAAFRDVANPVEYDIRISRKTSEGLVVVDEDRVPLNRYVADMPLSPGTYQWMVRTQERGVTTAWSEAIVFTIHESERVLAVDASRGLVDGFKEALARADAEKGKSVRIVIPPGEYGIASTFQGYLFDVSGRENIVIDGTGVRIRFSSRKQGLLLAKDARGIAAVGFHCLFARGALRVQGKVRAIDHTARRITLSVEEGFPGFDASDNQKQDILYLLEPGKTGRLKTAAPSFLRAQGPITRGADGTWSFPCGRDLDFCRVGDRYGFNFRSGSLHLVDASEAHGVTLFGLRTNGWGGMQYVSMGGGDLRILHCKAQLVDGDWMTGNADGVHVRGHDIGPWMEGSEINAIGDDAVALYARPATMKAQVPGPDRNTVVCRAEFFNLEPGDDVSFFQPTQGRILSETNVQTVTPEKGGYRVRFADPLPDGIRYEGPLQQVTQIWNRSKSCGDFMVRSCRFTNIRRYGTVFRSKRGVVENNEYAGISSRAVSFRNEAEWPNGLYASEIIVRGNAIRDTGFDNPGMQPAVAFLFSGYKCAASGIGPRKILIENNTFESGSRPEMQFTSTRDVMIRNNRRRTSEGCWAPASFQARHCEHIQSSDP